MHLNYKTYHYGDNNIDDSGWGCSYRNIQTIISCYKTHYDNSIIVPCISQIVSFFKKDIMTKNKRDLWIEPYHIGKYIKHFMSTINGKHYAYVIDDNDFSKILKTDILFYLEQGRIVNTFDSMIGIIKEHFKKSHLPVVIDDGLYSYCFLMEDNNITLIDPHRTENKILKKDISFLKKKFFLYYFPDIIKV